MSTGAVRSPSPGWTSVGRTSVPAAVPDLTATHTGLRASPTTAPIATAAALTVVPAAPLARTVFAITGSSFAPNVTL